jgi:hypothetical protein
LFQVKFYVAKVGPRGRLIAPAQPTVGLAQQLSGSAHLPSVNSLGLGRAMVVTAA